MSESLQRLQQAKQKAEERYAKMYESLPHNLKDLRDDACAQFAEAIQAAEELGLDGEKQALEARVEHVKAVYEQLRGGGKASPTRSRGSFLPWILKWGYLLLLALGIAGALAYRALNHREKAKVTITVDSFIAALNAMPPTMSGPQMVAKWNELYPASPCRSEESLGTSQNYLCIAGNQSQYMALRVRELEGTQLELFGIELSNVNPDDFTKKLPLLEQGRRKDDEIRFPWGFYRLQRSGIRTGFLQVSRETNDELNPAVSLNERYELTTKGRRVYGLVPIKLRPGKGRRLFFGVKDYSYTSEGPFKVEARSERGVRIGLHGDTSYGTIGLAWLNVIAEPDAQPGKRIVKGKISAGKWSEPVAFEISVVDKNGNVPPEPRAQTSSEKLGEMFGK